jgi:uncharacterized protein involved in exopolysaccharide biosynthesis
MGDGVADDFAEPRTLDEAHARRLRAKADVKEIERQLCERRVTVPGAPTSREHLRWRKAAAVKLQHLQLEMARLNQWVKTYHANYQRVLVEGSEASSQIRTGAMTALKNLLQYCNGLENRVRELEAENADLRGRLAALENPPPAAPGEGVDEWRGKL